MTWGGNVGEENAQWLATECRTARLASEYRPRDRGGGYVEISALALGALRELSEEEDGYITDDGDGLRIWIGDAAFELEPAELGVVEVCPGRAQRGAAAGSHACQPHRNTSRPDDRATPISAKRAHWSARPLAVEGGQSGVNGPWTPTMMAITPRIARSSDRPVRTAPAPCSGAGLPVSRSQSRATPTAIP